MILTLAEIDKLKNGDVVIRRKANIAILCAYDAVLDDGKMPEDWKSGTLFQAYTWAKQKTANTGGQIYEIYEDDPSQSN